RDAGAVVGLGGGAGVDDQLDGDDRERAVAGGEDGEAVVQPVALDARELEGADGRGRGRPGTVHGAHPSPPFSPLVGTYSSVPRLSSPKKRLAKSRTRSGVTARILSSSVLIRPGSSKSVVYMESMSARSPTCCNSMRRRASMRLTARSTSSGATSRSEAMSSRSAASRVSGETPGRAVAMTTSMAAPVTIGKAKAETSLATCRWRTRLRSRIEAFPRARILDATSAG